MNITYDKKEHNFLVHYEDGIYFWISYHSLVKLLAQMAEIPDKPEPRAPTSEELEEFWNSEPCGKEI